MRKKGLLTQLPREARKLLADGYRPHRKGGLITLRRGGEERSFSIQYTPELFQAMKTGRGEGAPSTYGYKYRSRLQIATEILAVCRERPVNITSIMLHANLSSAAVKKHVDLLLTRELLSPHREGFQTTEKGVKLLRSVNRWRRVLETL